MSEHDSPLCAALGHYVASLCVAYCLHEQRWIMVVAAGDETDDQSWRWQRFDFGPFDGREDVLDQAKRELERLLRADLEGWRAQQQR